MYPAQAGTGDYENSKWWIENTVYPMKDLSWST
jgi:hypothetical protein